VALDRVLESDRHAAYQHQLAGRRHDLRDPIKLHEGGRHTASSLGDDAGVDREINQRTLGHANFEMTGHYTHPEAARFRQAAEDVARYVEEAGS
jgi:hypothetical protein